MAWRSSGDKPLKHRFKKLDMHLRTDVDDEPLEDRWSREQHPLV